MLINHYQNLTKLDLIHKTNLINVKKIPSIEKVILNIGEKNISLNPKRILILLTLMELVCCQKPAETKSKKNKIMLKIKKGMVMGCKITLRKKRMFNFLNKLLIFIFPKRKTMKKPFQKVLTFQILNLLDFIEVRNEFVKFKSILKLPLTVVFSLKVNKIEEPLLLYNSLNLFKI